MIYGIGTDLCDLRRIAATLTRRGDRFAQKVLGTDEINVFLARRGKLEARGLSYLATRFSAKESFAKAIGLGIRLPMTWRDCQILNTPSGRPFIQLSGALAEWFDAKQLVAHVSLSDETDYATSIVIVEHRSSPQTTPK